MKILVTGASGLLGRELMATDKCMGTFFTNNPNRYDKFNYYKYHQLDVTYNEQVFYLLEKIRPDVIIHCAAVGSVDFTEKNYTFTRNVNFEGTKNLIDAANELGGIKIIYISTNAVYDGDTPPYSEMSERHPINAYGRIKKDTENLIMEEAKKWMIVRPFMLYGIPHTGARSNWFVKILAHLSVNKEIELVDDTFWQLSSAKDCAKGILELIEKGTDLESYNLACDERISLYGFGLLIARVMGFSSELIKGVSSNTFPTIAPRPKDTHYDTKKIKDLGIVMNPPEVGIEEYL